MGKGVARNILLVGSMPMDTAAEVFEMTAGQFGDQIQRIPDGETGARANWIQWQRPILENHPKLVARERPVPSPIPLYGLADGVSGPVNFDNLGYADAALESWKIFKSLKSRGKIRTKHRFQVSLPTPLAVVAQYTDLVSQPHVEVGYTERLLAEATQIFEAIPPEELAFQWDVAVEMAVLEGITPVHFDNSRQGVLDRLIDLINFVPEGVELGIHLCYGDSGHKHFKEPEDTALMVEVSNALAVGAKRNIDWLHMPVPRDRDDDEYFAPLKGLSLGPETELFLGLVHQTGGRDGTEKRMAAAKSAVTEFGLATECGWGRRTPEAGRELYEIHLACSHV